MFFHEHLHCLCIFPCFSDAFVWFSPKKHPMLSLWISGSSKIPGAGRPSNESAGHWTRDGLLLQAGERKVEAELFPRAQAVRVGGADLGHEGLRNLDEGDDAVLFFVLMSILSPVLFFPFAGGCYVDVFSGGITSWWFELVSEPDNTVRTFLGSQVICGFKHLP